MRRIWILFLLAFASTILAAAPAAASPRVTNPAGSARVTATGAVSHPMIRVPPTPGLSTRAPSNVNAQSTNWAGYAAETDLVSPASGAVSDVVGSWVVPTVTGGSQDAYSVDWVGIDGFESTSVEQIGTEADWSAGSPVYAAWIEMYPDYPVTIPMAIHPGDVMRAEVRWLSGNTFALMLTDTTTGASFSTNKTLGTTAARSSAEWVHEAPATTQNVLPLAQTTAVPFFACSTTIGGATGPIGDSRWQHSGIDMVQSGITLQQAYPLDATLAAFSTAVQGTRPHLWTSASSLAFQSTAGAGTAVPQRLLIANAGGGTIVWNATSDAPAWLKCSPASGGSGGSSAVSVDPTTLAAGTYSGHVMVSAPGADDSPVTIPVRLVVHPSSNVATPPATTLSRDPGPGASGWNDTTVTAGLSATDWPGGPGVAGIHYILDGVAHSYATSFTVGSEGSHTLQYWAVDAAGTVEPAHTATIRIDRTAPVTTSDAKTVYAGPASIALNPTDALSGVASTPWTLDGTAGTGTKATSAGLGTHTLEFWSIDKAGNVESPHKTVTFKVTLGSATTSTKLTGASAIKAGAALKLAGTISPSAAPGRVTIAVTRLVAGKWNDYGSVRVNVAAGTYGWTYRPKYRGSWRFSATYTGGTSGATTYRPSRSAIKSVTAT